MHADPASAKSRRGTLDGLVHLVDDDEPFRTALSRLLRANGLRVADYASAAEFLARNVSDDRPACLLLDVNMPGVNGPELQASLAAQGSRLPIVYLTACTDVATGVRAIKTGADDFLVKPAGKTEVLAALERAFAHFEADRRAQSRRAAGAAALASLTPRERQVFAGVIAGKANKVIARELGTSVNTVKAHRARVMEKTGVRSVAGLTQLALQMGIEVPRPGTDAPAGAPRLPQAG